MDHFVRSFLLFLLFAPIFCEASTPVESRTDHVVVTSIVNETAGPVTQTQIFVPTTYLSLATLSTTITTTAVVTIEHGTSTILSTYLFQIGPGGIGWEIPMPGTQTSVVLPPPTFLPGHQSSSYPNLPSTDVKTSTGTSAGAGVTHTGSSSTDSTGSNTASTAPDTSSSGSKTSVAGSSITFGSTSEDPSSRATASGAKSVTTPGFTTPVVTTASSSTPGGSTPSSSTPNSSTPSSATSHGTTSGATTSGATTPSGTKSRATSSRGSSPSSGTPSSGTSVTVPSSHGSLSRGTSTSGQPSSDTSSTVYSSTEASSSRTSAGGQTSSENSSTGGYTATSGHTAIVTTSSILSTITEPPIGFSVSTLTETSVTNNTWATTTDNEGHSTVVPIILASGKPVVLWGLPPITNAEFRLPNLPNFNLPCIKLFGAPVGNCPSDPISGGDNPDQSDPSQTGKPSDDSSSTKASKTEEQTTSTEATSSAECTATQTVSNCEVNCAKYTTSNSCLSSTTICSETRTGCSVTGITSTISTSTSDSSSSTKCFQRKDIPVTDAPEPTDKPDYDDDQLRKRKHARELIARGEISPVDELGSGGHECIMTPDKASVLTRPAWPFATSQIVKPELSGMLNEEFKTISRYDMATTTSPCDVPTLIRVDASGFANAPTYTDMANKNVPENRKPSLDHAYEKSWLKSFFDDLLGSATNNQKLSCQDFNKFFFPKAKLGTNPEQHSMLQPVWDALASNDPDNFDFILMSQYINGAAKGRFFSNGKEPMVQKYFREDDKQMKKFIISTEPNRFKWGKNGRGENAEARLRQLLVDFELGLLGCLAMKADPMMDLIRRTNNRIWNKLRDLDSKMENPGCNNIDLSNDQLDLWKKTFPKGIAQVYKDFMITYIEKQVNEPPNYLIKLWEERIVSGIATARDLPDVAKNSNDPNEAGEFLPEWEELDNMKTAIDVLYKHSGSYEWHYTFSFTWEEESANHKRANSCPLPTASTSTKSSEKTSTSKSDSKSETSIESTSKTTDGTSSAETTTKTSTRTSRDSLSHTSGEMTITATSDSTSTDSASITSTDTATDTGVMSTRTSKVTAPAITVGTKEEQVDECSQGWGTYDVAAKATAPSNAHSQKFYIPVADRYVSADWEASFMDGFIGKKEDFDPKKLVDPRTVIKSWTVKTAADDKPVAEGKGGKTMQIKWKSPEKANGTYIELEYVDKSLEQQEWGIRAQGGKSACMPDRCSDPPKEITDDNGRKCKKYPCSTQLSCEDSGEIRPHSECLLIEEGIFFPLWYDVSIVTNNWVHDDGKKLKSEEKGCGAMMDWHKKDIKVNVPDATGYNGGWTAVNRFTFTLPWTIASGCVERAIASAGGPKNLQCVTQASDWVFKRSLVGSFRQTLPAWARVF